MGHGFRAVQAHHARNERAGVKEIGVFYLGESFMGPRLLVDCIPSEIRAGDALRVPHLNARWLPEAIEACMKAGLDSLKWSVNAADEAVRENHGRVGQVLPAWTTSGVGMRRTATNRLYASSIRYDGEQQAKMEALRERVIPYVDQHYWLPLYSMGAFATEREAARLSPHRRQPGKNEPARAPALLVGIHRGPRHRRGQALGLLLRRHRQLDHGDHQQSFNRMRRSTRRPKKSAAR